MNSLCPETEVVKTPTPHKANMGELSVPSSWADAWRLPCHPQGDGDGG